MSNFFHSIRKAKLHWLVLGLLIFIWFLFCFAYLGEYAYKYPFVQNYRILLLKTIPNLLLPLLPLAVALFCLKSGKRVISLAYGCVFIIVLPLVWLNSVGELLYSPAICSYTEDPGNYGQYDPEVTELINLNGEGYLPDAIPSEAKNVRYHYLYEKASADTIYISVSWECKDGESQKLHSKYAIDSWKMCENGNKAIYLSEETPPGNIQPYFHAIVEYDETNNVVTHIMTNNKEYLPQDIGQRDGSPVL